LSKGDEAPVNHRALGVEWLPEMLTRDERGELINFVCNIGNREAVAAVEYSLVGMKEGGYRKVKAKPHLAYREEGVEVPFQRAPCLRLRYGSGSYGGA
jgi:hypothetical protein